MDEYRGSQIGAWSGISKTDPGDFWGRTEFQYVETPIVIDNTTKRVIDEAA